MVVRLSDIRPKTGKNTQKMHFSGFQPMMRFWANTYAQDCSVGIAEKEIATTLAEP